MTVKELIERLQEMPGDMRVECYDSCNPYTVDILPICAVQVWETIVFLGNFEREIT